MTLEFKIILNEKLKESDKQTFADLLKEQGKVKGNFISKAERCKFICIVYKDKKPIGIGGIKKKTESNFTTEKASLMNLANKFEWEYNYTKVNESLEIGDFTFQNCVTVIQIDEENLFEKYHTLF